MCQHPSPVSPNLGVANLGFSLWTTRQGSWAKYSTFDLVSSEIAQEIPSAAEWVEPTVDVRWRYLIWAASWLSVPVGKSQQDQGRWPEAGKELGFPDSAFSHSPAAKNGLKVTSQIWSVNNEMFLYFPGFLEGKCCFCLSSASYGNFCDIKPAA